MNRTKKIEEERSGEKEEGEVLLEKRKRKNKTTEQTLPQKFTFGVEKKIPPYKTEEEREMDEMWVDLASALHSKDAINTTAVRNDVVIIREVEFEKPINTATRCKRGIHNLILDDEIGLVCKHCYHVETEIGHYVEPFAKNPYCRSSKRESNKEGQSIFSKLHRQDSTDHSQLGCDLVSQPQVENQLSQGIQIEEAEE